MTISALEIGRIQGAAEFASINAIARKHQLAWATVKRAIGYKGPTIRKSRAVPLPIKRRRNIVAQLAKKRIEKNGRQYPVYCTANAIRKELERKRIFASKPTVVRDLHAMDMDCLVRCRVPSREPKVLDARRKFCSNWLPKRRTFKFIVWSDEHTISMNDHTSRTMWVSKDDQVIPRERQRLHNVPRVMVWAAVGVGFKSPIVMFPEKTVDADGIRSTFRLDASRYVRRCLSPIASELDTKRRIFQQDGAKPHQNNHVREYFGRKGIQHIADWPPYSPDLNMIEYVWADLNERVAERHPRTMQELQAAIKAAWDSIPQMAINTTCKGFENKLKEVLAKNGHC